MALCAVSPGGLPAVLSAFLFSERQEQGVFADSSAHGSLLLGGDHGGEGDKAREPSLHGWGEVPAPVPIEGAEFWK